MRIAIITSGYLPGIDGTTVVVHERCRQLSQWGHDVLIVGPDYAPVASYFPAWERHLGEVLPRVESVSVPCSRFFGVEWERNPTPGAFKVLEAHLDRFKPDVIHVDEPERLTYGYWRRPGLAYATRHGIPAVAFYHTNYVDYGPDFVPLPAPAMRMLQAVVRPCIASIYNAYAVTLVPGETTAAKLRGYGVSRMVVGRFNGVEYKAFGTPARSPGFWQRRFGLPDLGGRVVVLMVGRLTPDKGWAFAMKALPALAASVGPDRLAIVIAGGGEMADEVRTSLGGQLPHVHLLGRVPPPEMPLLYANADMHLSCSQKENFGLTALEAMASGIPVVTPRAGGFIDQITDGGNGAMFRPDDVRDFVTTVRPFIERADLRASCGQAGRAFAQEQDWSLTIRRWLTAVEATL